MFWLRHGEILLLLNTADNLIITTPTLGRFLLFFFKSMGLYRMKNESGPLVAASFLTDQMEACRRTSWIQAAPPNFKYVC